MRHTGNTVRPLYKTNSFALFSQRWIEGTSAGKTILCLRAQSMVSCGCSLKPIYALYQIINRYNPIKPYLSYLNHHFSSFPRYMTYPLNFITFPGISSVRPGRRRAGCGFAHSSPVKARAGLYDIWFIWCSTYIYIIIYIYIIYVIYIYIYIHL